MEYAMLKHDDGTPVPRTEALESARRWKAAVAKNGGRVPRDAAGPMVLDTQSRWHSRGLTLAHCERMLERQRRQVERDRRWKP